VNVFVRAMLRRLLGDRGEREAARWLRRQGYRILVRGYRTPRGEIDLIARDGDTIVFIEVKTRRQGEPAEAVTLEKQQRLSLAAIQFLKQHRLLDERARFDVVALVWPSADRPPVVEHIRNAFETTGRGQFFP
jgi:putative endonuclease